MSNSNANGDGLSLSGTGSAYVRVSGDKQDVERQYADLNGFERRHGVTIAQRHRYEDQMARDLSSKRPDFQRMLKEARAGNIQWIWVQRIDRFGVEDGDELVTLRRELRKAGCRLIDNSGTDWTNRDLLTLIRAGLAGEQSRSEQVEKSFRTLDGMVKKARDGEWQGGPPKLGFDVGCFDRASGVELWRVIFEGRDKVGTTMRRGKQAPVYHIRRLKVYPDGRSERLDGSVIFCTSKEREIMHITPTRDKAKLDAARGVFTRYATEAVSFLQLAKWLNSQGIRNSFGGGFQSSEITKMLSDESYLGYPTFNKYRAGRFHRYDAEGGITELETELKGRDSPSETADVIRSRERLYEPLVDRETWDKVQRKLSGREKRAYAPKKAGLYLSGLLICANCGAMMTAKTERAEYYCGTWGRYRSKGNTGNSPCPRNGVKHALLEEYIGRYLDESGKRLEMLTTAPEGGHLTDSLREQEMGAWRGFREGIERLTGYLAQHHPDEYAQIVREHAAQRDADERELRAGTVPLPNGTLASRLGDQLATALEEAKTSSPTLPADEFVEACVACYRANFDADGLSAEIARLEVEHTAMMKQWGDLPTPRAKEKAKQSLTALEGRIEELERQREDAGAVVAGYWQQMSDLQRAIRDARAAMKSEAGEMALRQRAEALRGLLCRIECTFIATGKGAGRGGARSRLVSVSFVPIAGDGLVFQHYGNPYHQNTTILRLLTVRYVI